MDLDDAKDICQTVLIKLLEDPRACGFQGLTDVNRVAKVVVNGVEIPVQWTGGNFLPKSWKDPLYSACAHGMLALPYEKLFTQEDL